MMADTSKYACAVFAVIFISVPVEPMFNDVQSESFSFDDDFEMPEMDISDLKSRMDSIQIDDVSDRISDIIEVPNADLWEKINNLKARLDKLEFISSTIESNITASSAAVSSYTASQSSGQQQTVDLSTYATRRDLDSLMSSIQTHSSNVQYLLSTWDTVQSYSSAEQDRLSSMLHKAESLLTAVVKLEEGRKEDTKVFKKCPSGWLDYKGHCYAYFRERLSWPHSAAVCLGHNSRLLQLETAEETRWIEAVDKSRSPIWGGGTNAFDLTTWTWAVDNKEMKTTLPQDQMYFLLYKYAWSSHEYVEVIGNIGDLNNFICEKW